MTTDKTRSDIYNLQFEDWLIYEFYLRCNCKLAEYTFFLLMKVFRLNLDSKIISILQGISIRISISYKELLLSHIN